MEKKPGNFKDFFEPFVRNYDASLSTYIVQEHSENCYSKQIVTKDIMKTMFVVMQDLRKSLHDPTFGCPFPPEVADFYMLRMAEYIFKGKVSKNSQDEFSTKLTRSDGRSYEDFIKLVDHIAHEVRDEFSGKIAEAVQGDDTKMLEKTLQNLFGGIADVSVRVVNADEIPEELQDTGGFFGMVATEQGDGSSSLTEAQARRILDAIFNGTKPDVYEIEDKSENEPNKPIQDFLKAAEKGSGIRGFEKSDEEPKLPKRFRLKRKKPNSEDSQDGTGN